MSDGFYIYGPFEIENKQKIVDKEHQNTYWDERVDKQFNGLSLAKGIYLFSLRNAENYNPQYVGMTTRDFRTEVFNDRNTVMVFKHFIEERGVLCLHLLARSKTKQTGFSINIDSTELFWLEDYIQQTCRIKNPYLLNIGKSKFLLKTAIEGLTDGTSGRERMSDHSGMPLELTIDLRASLKWTPSTTLRALSALRMVPLPRFRGGG